MNKRPPLSPPIQKTSLSEIPLSYSQESLWFIQNLDPNNKTYNLNIHLKFTGGVNHLSLERAVNAMVQRVETLRTIYPSQKGIPIQVVQPYKPFSMPIIDLSTMRETVKQETLKERIAELCNTPYDLQKGPIFRLALFHTSANEDHFFWSYHHIATDGLSVLISMDEFRKFYMAFEEGSEPELPELSIQYTDYAIWQKEWFRGEVMETYLAHWKEILSGELPVLELPLDNPRPAKQSHAGSRQYISIPADTYTRIQDFCRTERMAPFRFFLAAYTILLNRYTSQDDLIIGMAFANRQIPDIQRIQGFFSNVLPIRINLEKITNFQELFTQIRAITKDAISWQSLPFSKLVAALSPERDMRLPPIYQATINYKPVNNTFLAFGEGVEAEIIPIEEVNSLVDISLELDDYGSNLVAYFDYNRDLFEEETIKRIANHYLRILEWMASEPFAGIHDLDFLTETEYQQIIYAWNDTELDFPQVCMQDLISLQVERSPDELAVITSQGSLTYRQLEEQANKLAHYLRQIGVSDESRVGIYLPRTEKTIVVLLAILKAGGVYVPLEMTYPDNLINYIVNDSDPVVIITLSNLKTHLPKDFNTLCLDEEEANIAASEHTNLISSSDNSAPMYIIYTSGTTGLPKGVIASHKSVVNCLTHVRNLYQLNAADNLVQFLSLLFDGSVKEIFGTLAFGGKFFFTDDTQMRDPDFIYETIVQQKATWIKIVPTMLREICNSALKVDKRTSHVRLITPGGEALQAADVKLAREVFGQSVRIFNEYGPTEATITSTIYPVPESLPGGVQSMPIGKPIMNVHNYVLDKYQKPVPVGIKGELYIGGVGVGRGYWNKPEITAEYFLPDPFFPGERMYRSGDLVCQMTDGTISYLGRVDHQVKFRGYRVELDAIETALVNHPTVHEAAVKVFQDNNGDQHLVGYILPKHGFSLDKKQLREYLLEKFPIYMVPAPILEVQKISSTPNGKIDYKSLPAPDFEELINKDYIPPRNQAEKKLAEIWMELLGVSRVGRKDDFFDLGGHSLLAVQMISKVQQRFGQSPPLQVFFKDSTLEGFAASLKNMEYEIMSEGIIPIHPEGVGIPIIMLSATLTKYKHITTLLGKNNPVYGLHPFENGQQVYRESVQETAKILHRCLVNSFPEGPYCLLGHSADGVYALETARLLINSGKDVAFLGFFDTIPPPLVRFSLFELLVLKLKYQLKILKKKRFPDQVKYILQSIIRVSQKRWRKIKPINKHKKYINNQLEYDELKRTRYQLIAEYKPEVINIGVTIFTSTEIDELIQMTAIEKWSKVIKGEIDVERIEGGHKSILTPPGVFEIAKIIIDKLAAIEKNTQFTKN